MTDSIKFNDPFRSAIQSNLEPLHKVFDTQAKLRAICHELDRLKGEYAKTLVTLNDRLSPELKIHASTLEEKKAIKRLYTGKYELGVEFIAQNFRFTLEFDRQTYLWEDYNNIVNADARCPLPKDTLAEVNAIVDDLYNLHLRIEDYGNNHQTAIEDAEVATDELQTAFDSYTDAIGTGTKIVQSRSAGVEIYFDVVGTPQDEHLVDNGEVRINVASILPGETVWLTQA